MKPARRIVQWVMSTITVLVLLFGYRTSTAGPDAALGTGSLPVISGSANLPAKTPKAPAVAGTPKAPNASHAPHVPAPPSPRTVTGPSTATEWGPVQVEVTVSGTVITDVAVLQYPTGNSEDQKINSYALPVLVRETLDQQSAQIDMVSGATITSQGYLTSLQAALDEALA